MTIIYFQIEQHKSLWFSIRLMTGICRQISQAAFTPNFWIRNIFANFPRKEVWILIQVIVKFVNFGEREEFSYPTN